MAAPDFSRFDLLDMGAPAHAEPIGDATGGRELDFDAIPAPYTAPAATPAPVAAPTLDSVVAESAANANARRDYTAIAPTTHGNGEESVDTGASDAGIAALVASRATRAAQARVRAEANRAPLVAAPVVEDAVPVRLVHGNMVAGAGAEGHGVLIGFDGRKPMAHATLCGLAREAGMPEAWLPSVREPATQARRATHYQVRSHLTFYTEERGRKWRLERPIDTAAPGEKSGEVALVVSLNDDGTIDTHGDRELAAAVRERFDMLIGGAVHRATDITAWLREVLRYRLSAVKYGGNWYIPRRHRATAERICETFHRAGWGENWMVPALPIATTEQLAQGLANGLAGEIAEIIDEVDEAKATAAAKDKPMAEMTASRLLVQLRNVAERVCQYGALLGDKHVAACRDARRVRGDRDGVVGRALLPGVGRDRVRHQARRRRAVTVPNGSAVRLRDGTPCGIRRSRTKGNTMSRISTTDKLLNAELAVEKTALRIVRKVVKKPGITRHQLRFAFDARPGELAPAFKVAAPILKFKQVGNTAEVHPTDAAIDLVKRLTGAARRGPKSANSNASTAQARKVGGGK